MVLDEKYVGWSIRGNASAVVLQFIENNLEHQLGHPVEVRIEMTTKRKRGSDDLSLYTMFVTTNGKVLMSSKEMEGYNKNNWPLEMLNKFFLTLEEV